MSTTCLIDAPMIITQGKEIGKKGQIIQNINLFSLLIDLQGFSLRLFQCKLRFAWDQHGAVNGLDISMDGLDILVCINSLGVFAESIYFSL